MRPLAQGSLEHGHRRTTFFAGYVSMRPLAQGSLELVERINMNNLSVVSMRPLAQGSLEPTAAEKILGIVVVSMRPLAQGSLEPYPFFGGLTRGDDRRSRASRLAGRSSQGVVAGCGIPAGRTGGAPPGSLAWYRAGEVHTSQYRASRSTGAWPRVWRRARQAPHRAST